MELYEKVLKLMQTKPSGKIDVNDPELVSLLGKTHYRLPTYISFIRKYANLDVNALRGLVEDDKANPGQTVTNNRKVTAYQLVAVAATEQPEAAVSNT